MNPLRTLSRFVLRAALLGFLLGGLAIVGSYLYLRPDLPSSEALRDIRMQVPLRVLTRDRQLIAEFGEVKRQPLLYAQTPDRLIKAILAAEDDRFFVHPGVDYQGILRAVWHLLLTGKKSQGGSTITMQVARNFFLSREKTYLRKLSEIFLALRMEQELSKEEILELYINKIYLGNRSYGVAAAANVYYGRRVEQLSLPQIAMIAGLPKAPSSYNPIANRPRATQRRNYVLRRMHELGYISETEYQQARVYRDQAVLHGLDIAVKADFAAEMARKFMLDRYGREAYTGNYQVITSLESKNQLAAQRALRIDLHAYDERHGYRGIVRHVELSLLAAPGEWDGILAHEPVYGDLKPVLVTFVDKKSVLARAEDGAAVQIDWPGLKWARPYVDDNHRGARPRQARDILSAGDIIFIRLSQGKWRLAQLPGVEGALVSLRPRDGAVLALSGGYDFHHSKFNRVTQAYRQPGSNFKPFLYSAALEKGYTAASLINDAPVVFDDPGLENAWRPENYSGKFFGPTRLREALIHSRNLVSIRLMRAIGPPFVIDYAEKFGFKRDKLPNNLSLALGSGVVTPMELATAYSALANGGYRVHAYLVEKILGPGGSVLYEAMPEVACDHDCPLTVDSKPALVSGLDEGNQVGLGPRIAPRIMTPENNFIMNSLLRDVIRRGTGRGARRIGRHDLAGKTGTTNEQVDAWFSGFNQDVVAVCWVGFDQVRSLGRRETGARAALPMWVSYMSEALAGVPERSLVRPKGLVTVRIDPQSGLLASSQQRKAIFETFRSRYVPNAFANTSNDAAPEGPGGGARPGLIPEQLF